MADVMDAFTRGRTLAMAEQEHSQRLSDSKLQQQILKHQIDRMKIEDQVRERAIQAQNLEMMNGMPEADLPTEDVPHAPNEPPVQMGVQPDTLGGRVRQLMGGGAPNPMEERQGAEGLAPVPLRQRSSVNFGAVDGVAPGFSVRPRSLEELVQQALISEFNKVREVPRGGTVMMGGQVIGRGEAVPPTRTELGVKAAGGDKEAKSALDLAFPARAGAQDTLTSETVALDGKPNQKVLKNRAGQYYTLDKQPIENAATRIAANPRQPTTNNDPEAAVRRNYQEFAKTYRAQNPMPTAADYLAPGADLSKPLPKPPAPPTFEKWKVMTLEERQGVIRDPNARIDDAEMSKRTKAGGPAGNMMKETKKNAMTPQMFTAALSAKGQQPKPGTRYHMTDGTIFDVLPDGTIDGPKTK